MVRLSMVLMVAAFVCGCQERVVEPVKLANDTWGPMKIAVAPALNQSGSADVDPNRVADLMASELSYVEDVAVIPVNRVLAALVDQGRSRVESPGHALEVARLLGADAVLVFAITEYDAYEPIVGITAQLYGRTGFQTVSYDPVAESRRASPGAAFASNPLAPIAQTQQVFNASHEWVCEEVKRFASVRSADTRSFNWRRYVASQQQYLRFCCHETIRALIGLEPQGEASSADRLE